MMTRVTHILRLPIIPGYGTQPHLPGLGLTDRPAPLLLEEKGLGDEVHATKEKLGDDSLSVSIEEKGLGDEVDATKERPEDDSLSLSVSIEEKRLGEG